MNGLVIIQPVCLLNFFFFKSGAKIKQNIRSSKSLEKHSVVAPLVQADVLSSLATKPNLNSSEVKLSPLSPPLCVFISRKKCCAFVVCLCKQGPCENSANRSRWLLKLYCHEHYRKTGRGEESKHSCASRPYLESTADLFELLISRQP